VKINITIYYNEKRVAKGKKHSVSHFQLTFAAASTNIYRSLVKLEEATRTIRQRNFDSKKKYKVGIFCRQVTQALSAVKSEWRSPGLAAFTDEPL
ncbi:hypothetical protein D917_04663, partial [Trichinella nativa]